MKDIISTTTALVYGFICHSMFLAGNGFMMVSMYYGMMHCNGTLDRPWAYLVNALLLIQFPLTHSFMVSTPGRKLLSKLAPGNLGKPLSATTYVIIAASQIFLLFFAWRSNKAAWYPRGLV